MLEFARKNNVSVRGHNIFWDNPIQNKAWVKELSPRNLMRASKHRLNSLLSRYKGQVIAWDAVNENLHFSFFEDKLGANASAVFYKMAHKHDSKTIMFMNEFNTLEHMEDQKSSPAKYLEKIKEIRSFPGNEKLVMGIGLQSHFGEPNIPYVRASLDTLGATKMPIWLTELDVERIPKQAEYLEEIMREAYSHPAVKGIIVWSGWKPTGCSNMCLTDNNFKNLPTGDVVDKLIAEWKTQALVGKTSVDGIYEDEIFLGEYIVTISSLDIGEYVEVQLEVNEETSEPLDVFIFI